MPVIRRGAFRSKLSLLIAPLLLLAACSSEKTPGAVASPSSSAPRAFPSQGGSTGVVGTPLVAPSYSPYGFETCDPDEIEMPDWVPADLPLPDGIYATALRPQAAGYEQAYFVIPGDTTFPEFTRLVVEDWPEAGYQLGRGDSEAGEIESEFSKPPATGAFKVQATTCSPAYSVMLLIYAPNGPASPTPSS